MSLRIIREGLLDTVQDLGRKGFQHLGINPGGVMDRFSAQLANALLGIEPDAPVLELHFPSAQILFESQTVIAICGADFDPIINQESVPMHHPIAIAENSLLQFRQMKKGARVYVAILNGLQLEPWKGSYSTNLKAGAGGFQGRALRKYDQIFFSRQINISKLLGEKCFSVLPWKALDTIEHREAIEFVIGSEWHSLDAESRKEFEQHWFQIGRDSDRMGYKLKGPVLKLIETDILSSGVGFGTVQLLPDRSLIVLMADHQTTGGYPRIAHVISAHLPILAQKNPGDVFMFKMTDLETAEEKISRQQKYLEEIRIACKFRIENLVHVS